MTAYYNEFKPEAAHMLRALIKDGLIAKGEVDERSITEVKPDDLKGFTQCHFFAGIGGWSVALRQAGWSDDRPVWTGSCPCQPFSTAGKQKGTADERHLWPVWFNLIRECGPSTIFGEQVSSAIAHGWLDEVANDLEGQGYAFGSAVLPACSVNAPHKRDRLWFVANTASTQRETGAEVGGVLSGMSGNGKICNNLSGRSKACAMGNTIMPGLEGHGRLEQEPIQEGRQGKKRYGSETGFWSDHDWIICGDGKARRVPSAKSGICIVANGVQHRAPLLHAYGNAIVPQVAARFIQAAM